MIRFVRRLGIALVAITMTASAAGAQGVAQAGAQEEIYEQVLGESPDRIVLAQGRASTTRRSGVVHVYLLRGFMDIFSTGMNDLADKLRRRGISASAHGHGEYPSLADGIAQRWRSGIRERVVIIGHSLGANAAPLMAARLGEHKIPVPLIITYDPTTAERVPANVGRAVNFYSSENGWGVALVRGPGFRGALNNIDLASQGSIGHTDIDKSPRLHEQSIRYIASLSGARRPAPRPQATQSTSRPKAETQESRADSSKADSEAKSADKESDKSETAEAEAAGTETAEKTAGDNEADTKADITGSAQSADDSKAAADGKAAGESPAKREPAAEGSPSGEKTAASPQSTGSNEN